MSQLLSAIPGGSAISSLLGGAASVAQPGPSAAYRGDDYNPVTNINAVGAPDYSQLASLVTAVNAGSSTNGGGLSSEVSGLLTGQSGTNYDNLIIIGALILVGIIVWKKFAK
jgi:hypothetical protein